MGNNVKYHIFSSIANLIILFVTAKINILIVDLIDPMIFIKRGGNFDFLWPAYALIFFWSFTLTIYLIKRASKHLYLFLTFGLLVMFIRVVRNFIYTEADFLLFLINGVSETIIFIILTSIGIHYSQLYIGKKFLPGLYK